jgi:hypothetical protein
LSSANQILQLLQASEASRQKDVFRHINIGTHPSRGAKVLSVCISRAVIAARDKAMSLVLGTLGIKTH